MSARLICVEILAEILEQKQFFNTLKNRFLPQDLAFGNYLILSVLRHLTSLEKILFGFVRKPFSGKNKPLLYILLCGISELLLTDTPDYAVLNEYVSIAKKKTDKYAAGMVNALLRQVARQKESLKKGDLRPAFSKKYRQLLQKDYDAGQIVQMEQMLGVLPPLDISVSKDAPKWAEKLGGILFENGTIRLTEPNLKITELAGFSEGAWWVQDLAASLPVALLGDVSGQKILDLCAAPGGKTAQLLAKGAYVTAVDIDPIRLEKLRENIDRLQLSDRLTAEVSEGLAYLTQTEKRFDAVVLDVPCSATGTFRRHPEVVHIKTKEDVDKQLAVQARLLENAALCLNDGGRILYCTCSIAHAEGEEQIARFLENHPDFEIIEHKEDIFALTGGKRFEKHFLDKGLLRTLPYNERQTGGMDAFFAVCIRKSSA